MPPSPVTAPVLTIVRIRRNPIVPLGGGETVTRQPQASCGAVTLAVEVGELSGACGHEPDVATDVYPSRVESIDAGDLREQAVAHRGDALGTFLREQLATRFVPTRTNAVVSTLAGATRSVLGRETGSARSRSFSSAKTSATVRSRKPRVIAHGVAVAREHDGLGVIEEPLPRDAIEEPCRAHERASHGETRRSDWRRARPTSRASTRAS